MGFNSGFKGLKRFNLDFDKFVGTNYIQIKQIKSQNTFHAEFVHFVNVTSTYTFPYAYIYYFINHPYQRKS